MSAHATIERSGWADLRTALDTSGVIGVWEWELDTNTLYMDEAFARLLSVDPVSAARGMPGEAYIANIHPDDLAILRERNRYAVRNGRTVAEEFRVLQPDGSVRWILSQARCVRDASGMPVRFLGVCIDNTERKLCIGHDEADAIGLHPLDRLADVLMQARVIADQGR